MRPRAPAGPPRPRDFEAAIARIERSDSGSPAALNARIDFAGFLIGAATGPSCRQRLIRAQEQIGRVGASAKRRVLYPHGSALVADLEYREDLALAACGSRAGRRAELYAAVAAERRAVMLYRSEFANRSMVIMQFDVAVALHRLAEKSAALAALRTALRMDREFGLRGDARQNEQVLLRWRGEPAGPAQIAAIMRHFPQRSATLKFDWHPSDARTTVESHRVCLVGGQLVRSRAAATFERRISAGHGGAWQVSYTQRLKRYQPGVWPLDPNSRTPWLPFAPTQPTAVNFKVSANGEFQRVTGLRHFSARLTARTDELVRESVPADDNSSGTLNAQAASTALDLSPGLLEAATAERYRLETSMWIGATLKLGVWYRMSAPLSLPGLQRCVVEQHITFAFTRRVPCAAGEAARRCIEIVLHVTPEKKELSPLLADIRYLLAGIGPRYFGRQFFHYDASITARIVIDPATLLPCSREERIDWYASAGTHKADSILQADHVIATTRYGTPRARPQAPAAQSAHAASPLTPRESVRPGDSAVAQ